MSAQAAHDAGLGIGLFDGVKGDLEQGQVIVQPVAKLARQRVIGVDRLDDGKAHHRLLWVSRQAGPEKALSL
jgi:hypothetical protein